MQSQDAITNFRGLHPTNNRERKYNQTMMLKKATLVTASVFLAVFTSFGQQKSQTAAQQKAIDSVYYSTTKYREIGPFRGGRNGAVAGSYKNKNTFYFGATGGGVWKTTDGGVNWKNISDKYFGGSIGSVAVARPMKPLYMPAKVKIHSGGMFLKGCTACGAATTAAAAGSTWVLKMPGIS